MTELEERLQNFETACLELFRVAAILDRGGLPFTIDVQDAHGNSLLSAQLAQVPGGQADQPELVYLDDAQLQDLMN